jgi:hypothetical protein
MEVISSTKEYLVIKDENNKLGLMSSNGITQIAPKYDNLELCDGVVLTSVKNEEKIEYRVIDCNGNTIFTSDSAISYVKGFFYVKSSTDWYSVDGKVVYKGESAVPVSKDFLLVNKNGNWGVIGRDGERLINYLYNEIQFKNTFFVVRRDDKIGLVGRKGEVIVDVIYDSLESVCIENSPAVLGEAKDMCVTFGFEKKYIGYCKEYCFDTEEKKDSNNKPIDRLCRHKISVKKESGINKFSIEFDGNFELSAPIILTTGEYQELFKLSDGVIPNSKYTKIEQITQISYVVKQQNKYGIYRIDTASVLIPINYERIQFYGGHTVLLCNGGCWGAKDILLPLLKNYLKLLYHVDIPLVYTELCILDLSQSSFGGKSTWIDYVGEEQTSYTIINANGEESEELQNMHLESQFVRYDKNHYLTKKDGKYGFVSVLGYTSIPFIYDEVALRKGGSFNVRIGNSWGVIDITGRELVRIKYSKPIPLYVAAPEGFYFDYDDLKDDIAKDTERNRNLIIVSDAKSGCFGCVNLKGEEVIPTVFERLMFPHKANHFDDSDNEDGEFTEDDVIFFGLGGYENDDSTFFSNIQYAKWGCINKDGQIIIDPKYDCFKFNNGFILAGRDGDFLGEEDNNDHRYYDRYSGVYDLYTSKGELLIGGFREMHFDQENNVFALFFGGSWERYCSYYDEWNNLQFYDYRFSHSNDLWLILDTDLNTIIRKKDNSQHHFSKGFIGKIEIKKEGNKVTHVYNMPIDLMAKGFSRFGKNCVFVKEGNSECNKTAALDYRTGLQTPYYDLMSQINEKLFFVAEKTKVGVRTISDLVLPLDYYFFTIPVYGFFFAAKEIDEKQSSVFLFNTKDLSNPVCIAIEKYETNELIDDIGYGLLKINFVGNPDLTNLQIARRNLFSSEFLGKINSSESNYFVSKWKDNYFFSDDGRIGEQECSGDYYDDDESDYARDTWDAMTDGMYGDMPDGFDGDYDFLGR